MHIDQVRKLFPRAAAAHAQAFAAVATTLFKRFEIDASTNRLQFFLAQIGHESGGLTLLEENLKYRADRLMEVWPQRFPTMSAAQVCAGDSIKLANKVYCDRMGNGPELSGDGWRFRGRGYIQITGRDAYRTVGKMAGLRLEEDPEQALAPEHALATACGVWLWKDCSTPADRGDFSRVTKLINGGLHGFDDRKAWLDKVRRVFSHPPAPGDEPAAPDVIAVQRALQEKGYTELGAADGELGPRTLAAITRYREEHGLPPGGIDAALVTKLELD